MKSIPLLIASLFVALVAFAESPKQKETKAAAPADTVRLGLKTIASMSKAPETPQEKPEEK